jgi:hypothetical protein
MRIGLGGVPDAHLALRRLREEPLRAAVADIFTSRPAEEAFLPEPAGAAGRPTEAAVGGPEPAAAGIEVLTMALERLARAAGSDLKVVSTAQDMVRLGGLVRGVRPRLLAQAVAGWAVFNAVGEIACDGDPARTTQAFDDWDAAQAVGDLARRAGSTDAAAWRAVELTRALLSLPPGTLARAVEETGLPPAWFELAAVRAASGWNEWQGATYLSQERWGELVESIAARDSLLGLPDAAAAASELARRAAAAGYRLAGPEDAALSQSRE